MGWCKASEYSGGYIINYIKTFQRDSCVGVQYKTHNLDGLWFESKSRLKNKYTFMKKILLSLLVCFSVELNAQIFIPSAIPASADTFATMQGVDWQYYKFHNLGLQQNKDTFPIYVRWEPGIGFRHMQGFMEIPCAHELNPVILSPSFGSILDFKEYLRSIHASQKENNSGSLTSDPPTDCIAPAIHFTAMCWASGTQQWENNRFEDCHIIYPDDTPDLQFVNIKADPGATLVLGGASNRPSGGRVATLYYGDLARHSFTYVGLSSIVIYLKTEMHARVFFEDSVFAGTNQILGEGDYYNTHGMHSDVAYAKFTILDSSYHFWDVASYGRFGQYTKVNKKNIVVGKQSHLVLGDSSQVNGHFLMGDCSSFKGVDSTATIHIMANTNIGDLVYINNLPGGTIWPGGTVEVDHSTVQFDWNIGTDTTPDAAPLYKWGNATITCDSDSISIIEIQGLRKKCFYEYTAAPGKVVTFVSGSGIKMKHGDDFVCNGDNEDVIIFKTKSNGKLKMISAINY